MRSQISLTLFTVLAAATWGCGTRAPAPASTAPGSAAAASSTGSANSAGAQYDTPAAVYAALATASKSKDWKSAAAVLTGDSQAIMAGSFIMGASFAAMGDEVKDQQLKELLASHGIDLDAADAEPPADQEDAGPEAMMKAMTKSIQDLPTFVGEIASWIEKNSDSKRGGFAAMGELGEVTVEGDAARATSQTDMGPQPIEFRKINGSWLIHLPMDGPRGSGGDASHDFEDDDTPGLGTLWYGEEAVPLRHAVAYRSKFFDDPCIVVLLTAQPIYERDMNRLQEMLRDEESDDVFFASGPNVKLSLDEDGKMLSMFAWIDNMSINRNNGVDVDVQFDDDRVRGMAGMLEADEIAETSYRFDAIFDVAILQP